MGNVWVVSLVLTDTCGDQPTTLGRCHSSTCELKCSVKPLQLWGLVFFSGKIRFFFLWIRDIKKPHFFVSKNNFIRKMSTRSSGHPCLQLSPRTKWLNLPRTMKSVSSRGGPSRQGVETHSNNTLHLLWRLSKCFTNMKRLVKSQSTLRDREVLLSLFYREKGWGSVGKKLALLRLALYLLCEWGTPFSRVLIREPFKGTQFSSERIRKSKWDSWALPQVGQTDLGCYSVSLICIVGSLEGEAQIAFSNSVFRCNNNVATHKRLLSR